MDFAEKLGISKSLNKRIVADSCDYDQTNLPSSPTQVSLLASTDVKAGERKDTQKSFSKKIISLFLPTNTDSTSLMSSKARKAQAEQDLLKKKQAKVATRVARVTKYTPILRLENGAFTRAEWLCILQHSIIKNVEKQTFL